MQNNLPSVRRTTLSTIKMQKRKRRFLAALAECGQVTKAAAAAGVKDSSAVYRWRQSDKEFRDCWDGLADAIGQVIEDKLVERVVNGVEEPLTYKGEIFGWVKRYDNATGVALLRGLRPQKFREAGGAIHVNLNQNIGMAVLPVTAASEEEWEAQSKALTAMQNKIAAQVIDGKAERVEEPARLKRG